MRRFVLVTMVLLTVSAAQAQDSRRVIPVPLPGVTSTPSGSISILPVPFGPSTSAIDHNGNLLIFDVSYSRPTAAADTPLMRGALAAKTRLTVITNAGTRMTPVEYEGTYQVLGSGRYAVYALVSSYTSGATTRRLMAFNVSGGVALSPLPALDVSLTSDVKLSAGDAGAPDLISIVEQAQSTSRTARIVKYNGGSNFDAGASISLP